MQLKPVLTLVIRQYSRQFMFVLITMMDIVILHRNNV